MLDGNWFIFSVHQLRYCYVVCKGSREGTDTEGRGRISQAEVRLKDY